MPATPEQEDIIRKLSAVAENLATCSRDLMQIIQSGQLRTALSTPAAPSTPVVSAPAVSAETQVGAAVQDEQIMYKPKDAAKKLGVHVNTLYRWIEEEGLPARTFTGSGNYYVPRLALEEWANDWKEKRKK